MEEIMEVLEDIAQTEEAEEAQEETVTDEEIEAQIYAEDDDEGEEVNMLDEEGEEPETQEQEEAQEDAAQDEPAHKARDEPSADELFARRVREAYGGMSDEQIMDAMLDAQAQKMHEEDPEISVKAAKMILQERAKTGGVQTAKTPETDAHMEALKAQAQEMAATKEGAALLKEMLADETVKTKIDKGEWDVKQARAYYEGKRESEAESRKAPTTIKARSAVKAASKSVKNMSDAEFARLEARMDEAFEQGKRPRL
jgi:S-DNA-T family DNA segregation ATPase FtsK/SpoIIIE